MMQKSLLLLSTFLPLQAQATTPLADGQIVPFTSGLPACASLCGQLSNVQGACVPPVTSSVSQSCFCSDSRLTPFLQGPSSVATVCSTGGTACTSTSDLQAIETWYEGYCNDKAVTTASSSAAGSTSTSSSGSSSGSTSSKSTTGNTWFSTHYKWVIMLIILALGIPGLWAIAFIFRRRYLRKRDKEFEMRPPVALGPHQMQGMTGGYTSGDGVGNRAGADVGGHQKEAKATQQPVAAPANASQGKGESKGWLRKAQK